MEKEESYAYLKEEWHKRPPQVSLKPNDQRFILWSVDEKGHRTEGIMGTFHHQNLKEILSEASKIENAEAQTEMLLEMSTYLVDEMEADVWNAECDQHVCFSDRTQEYLVWEVHETLERLLDEPGGFRRTIRFGMSE